MYSELKQRVLEANPQTAEIRLSDLHLGQRV